MRKMLFCILGVCLISFTGLAFAQEGVMGDISLSNGSISSSAGNFVNTTSVNSGIVFTETLASRNFRLDSGVLASFVTSNNDITFIDPIPAEGAVSTTTAVTIGITAITFQGNVEQLGYRISNSLDALATTAYTWVLTEDSGSDTYTYSAQITSDFQPGVNFLQWFAQNTASVNGQPSSIFQIIVSSDAAGVFILLPADLAGSNPNIKANLISAFSASVNPSSVTIQMFAGASTNTVALSTEDANGKMPSAQLLDYRYTAAKLNNGGEYTLFIQFTDNGTVYSSAVTFKVDNDPIPQLLPYPSPYNPKSGKSMKIKYILQEDAVVTINIYDRAGKFVSKVIDSQRRFAGLNDSDEWFAKSYAGDDLASGVYICEIIAKGSKENRRYVSFAILRK
ncbi:MAG: hypothetical protein FWF00_02385 [Endomicrobia bacterium]|nr:hypothetical protein [Endomicrobiia bacterium]MCL2506524.1 hypothetical protein [Endomicrobiia bacterium]